MLEVNIRKTLGAFRLEASFTAAGQGVTALFGPSGSGKTSVINALAGLLKPDQGRVALDGRVFFDSQAGVNLPPHKRRVGYVFQEGRLFPHLSVRSNLVYGRNLLPKQERKVSLDQVVELMDIAPLLKRRPARLSGGEKQRVAVGRALLTSPRLLLMDEPLASLDQDRKNEVLPFLARLPQELSIPIIYVSHSPEEVEALEATVIRIAGGRTMAGASPGSSTPEEPDRLSLAGRPRPVQEQGKAAGPR